MVLLYGNTSLGIVMDPGPARRAGWHYTARGVMNLLYANTSLGMEMEPGPARPLVLARQPGGLHCITPTLHLHYTQLIHLITIQC